AALVVFLGLAGDGGDRNGHPAELEGRVRDKVFVEKVVQEAVRGAVGPLTAAAALGAGDSGFGARVSWSDGSVPQDLFADPRVPSPEPRAPPLLQVFDTYILFQSDSGVAIVDQHSAHERV